MRVTALGVVCLLVSIAHADGVAPLVTSVDIPDSTLAVIDPQNGVSTGTGSTSVKLSPGDTIAVRFRYLALPGASGSLSALQQYLTVYIPNNTQVVGARLLSADASNGVAVAPAHPGIAVDGTGVSASQLHADTGVFVTTDPRLTVSPLSELIAPSNGTAVTPVQSSAIAAIIDAPGSRAHNAWDTNQVNAFGGGGLPPMGRGSPVAGSGTFYANESGNVEGPWQRTRYRGSLIGTDPAGTVDVVRRTVLDASNLGADLTPLGATAGPVAGAIAVRIALGGIHVGRPGVAEVALRVLGTPLHTGTDRLNGDYVCGEIFGADTALLGPSASSPGARDNAWGTFVPTPACAFIDLSFKVRASKQLAVATDTVTFTLDGKNLSRTNETNARVFIGYDAARGTLGTLSPAGSVSDSCPGPLAGRGLTCRRWNLGTLAPSAAYTHTVQWSVGPASTTTNVLRAYYVSDQRPAGHDVQTVVIVKPTPMIEAQLVPQAPSVPAGSDLLISGMLQNQGTAATDITEIGVAVPTGWEVRNINIGGGATECAGPFTTEALCSVSSSIASGATRSLSYSVRPSAGTPTGLYATYASTWSRTAGFAGEGETFFSDPVMVAVENVRSTPPIPTCAPPFDTTLTAITGTSSEPDGTIIRVYFNGNPIGDTTVAGGAWTLTGIIAAFGPLYGGVEVRASATAANELESPLSAACFVAPPPPPPAMSDAGVDAPSVGDDAAVDGGLDAGNGISDSNNNGCGCSARDLGSPSILMLIVLASLRRRRSRPAS